MTKQATVTMDDLLDGAQFKQLVPGEVVEATVLSIKKHEVWLDLGINGVGMVPRREIGYGQKLEVGETVVASVVDPEIEEGQALLSLRKAAKDRARREGKI